jgi:hypothetical protein
MLPLVVGAADKYYWATWERELRRQCPANHVQWLSDAGRDELVSNFVDTLPAATAKTVSSIANVSRRCAGQTAGFSCEVSVHLDAFIQLNLLKRFAAFACREYKCTEIANCTKDGR